MVKKEKRLALFRLLALTLTVFMLIPCLPIKIFATTEETDAVFVYEELKDHLVKTEVKTTDGYIGIPVHLAIYNDPDASIMYDTKNYNIYQLKKRDVIFYVINWNGERIGQESDVSILSDYISQGYVVVTVDYLNNEKAVPPDIEHSLATLRQYVMIDQTPFSGTGISIRKYYGYFLPAGYRLKRDVEYFDTAVHASLGTLDYVLSVWNNYVAGKKTLYDGTTATTANTFEDCTDYYGDPLDTKFYLDIIYPSQPTRETPVYTFEATQSDRHRNTCDISDHERCHFVGFAFNGYTVVNVEHTFTLMQKTFGYFDPYKLHKENGAKAARASIRCIRYFADELGYSQEYIGVAGISKGSPYPAILGVKNNVTMPEYQNYSADPDGTLFEGGENVVQPYMTYDDGTEISSEVTVSYSAAGDGTRWFYEGVDGYFEGREFVPMLLSCGANDQYGMYAEWDGVQQFFADVATEIYLPIDMDDKGHDYPVGYDDELDYDRYNAMFQFFDYYLKPNEETSEVVWVSPAGGDALISVNAYPDVKFLCEMDVNSVNEGLVVVDSNGNELSGEWIASEVNSRFVFVHNGFDAAKTYTIKTKAALKDADGNDISASILHTFSTELGVSIRPVADAYVSSAEPDRVFGSAEELKISGASAKECILFATFETADLINSKYFRLVTNNDTIQTVEIYALDGYTVNEVTLCYSNMPNLGGAVYLGDFELSEGGNDLDISKLLNVIKAKKVTLAIKAKVSDYYDYSIDFEKIEDFSLEHKEYTNPLRVNESKNNGFSSVGFYRTGGTTVATGVTTLNENGISNKVAFVKADQNSDRIKFLNILADRALTAEDIGRTFKVSFRLKANINGTVSIGWMSAYSSTPESSYSTSYYKSSTVVVEADEWVDQTVYVTIDETMVSQQVSTLAIQMACTPSSADRTFYIDDIVAESVIPVSTISSREGKEATMVLIGSDKAPDVVADISWYDAKATDLYISDADDLWGLWGLTVAGSDATLDTVKTHVEACIAGNGTYKSESTTAPSAVTAGKTFHLTADIDLGGVNFPGFAEFSGNIDGHGYKITGFNQTHTTYAPNKTKHAGFIRNMTPTKSNADLVIKNLTLEGNVVLNYNGKYGQTNAVGLVGCFTTSGNSTHKTTAASTLTIENVIVDVDVTFNNTYEYDYTHRVAGVFGSCGTGDFSVNFNNVIYEGTVKGNVVNTTGKTEINAGTFIGEVTSTAAGVTMTNCLNRGAAVSNHALGTSTEIWTAIETTVPTVTTCVDAVSGTDTKDTPIYKTLTKDDMPTAEGSDWYLDETYEIIPAGIANNILNKIYLQKTEAADTNGKHRIRILGTLNSLELSRLEMDVYVYIGDADADSPADSEWKKIAIAPQNTVFTSVYAAGKSVTAYELGGEYLYGFVLTDIPEGATVSLKITPKKVMENGDVQALKTRTAVISL